MNELFHLAMLGKLHISIIPDEFVEQGLIKAGLPTKRAYEMLHEQCGDGLRDFLLDGEHLWTYPAYARVLRAHIMLPREKRFMLDYAWHVVEHGNVSPCGKIEVGPFYVAGNRDRMETLHNLILTLDMLKLNIIPQVTNLHTRYVIVEFPLEWVKRDQHAIAARLLQWIIDTYNEDAGFCSANVTASYELRFPY